MIIFEKIRWKNFLSTGNSFTDINLNKSRCTLIVGENGAGKSTILDALTFGLFGKPFRNINKPQLTNTINKKDTVVEIYFMIGKNRYKVVRGLKPVIFEVYQNDKLLNQNADQRDYQEVLEKQILNINHKSFCQVVVLGSASFVPFMQLTAANRRIIIEDILDLQIFTKMNLLLKDKIAQNTQDILAVEGDIRLGKEKIRLQREYNESIILSNQKTVEKKREQIAEFEKNIKESQVRVEMQQKEISSKKQKLAKLKKDSDKLQKLKDVNTQLLERISSHESIINFFNSHDNCPTCRQNIDHIYKEDVIKQKNVQIQEINDGISKLSINISELTEKVNEITLLNDDIFDINIDINRLNTKIQSWMKQVNDLNNEIDHIEVSSSSLINNDYNEGQLKDLELQYNKLIDDKEYLQTASTILKDGGIKAKIVKQYVPIINKLINKYLSAMDFFVNFELDDQFNETIKSRFRDDFTYASFSEGEKQKIDLALLFTWRAVAKLRNSMATNLLIMDEIFDSSLDSNAADNLMNIIMQLTSDSNIFIISHREQMNDKFTDIIRFSKSKNFSIMQE